MIDFVAMQQQRMKELLLLELVEKALQPYPNLYVCAAAVREIRNRVAGYSDHQIKIVENMITELPGHIIIEQEVAALKQVVSFAKALNKSRANNTEDFTCPECGGDMRQGVHQKRVSLDYYICDTHDPFFAVDHQED